jgi:hypothetical protein
MVGAGPAKVIASASRRIPGKESRIKFARRRHDEYPRRSVAHAARNEREARLLPLPVPAGCLIQRQPTDIAITDRDALCGSQLFSTHASAERAFGMPVPFIPPSGEA